MTRAAVVSLVALLIAPGLLAAEWLPNLDAAVARAQTENKLIVAVPPSKRMDSFLEKAEREPAIVHALQSFVLLRSEVKGVAGADVGVLDPNGLLVARVDTLRGLDAIAALLVNARGAADLIVRAAGERRSGNALVADYLLGRAYMTLSLYGRAQALLMKTSVAAGRAHNADLADVAQAAAGAALALSGEPSRGRALIDNVIRYSTTPGVIAEAWSLVGWLEANAQNRAAAVRAWRIAYGIAPAGSALANDLRTALEGVDQQVLAPKSASSATLALLTPPKKTIVGRAQFEAVPSGQAARVEFFLDDVPAGRIEQPPFRVTIDVGRTPSPRTVKAVSYDSAGAPIAEAVAQINDRADAFRVAINSPAGTVAKGVVDVEAEALVPPGRSLARFDLFWGGDRLASSSSSPVRATTELSGGFGYIRAVATLDDGTVAEAVRIFNATGTSGNVDVQGVTFAAVITDSRGRRLTGLRQADLVVEEDGVPVAFSIRENEEEPATIGLAIDVSSSMRQSMLRAFRYASEFVESGADRADRVFVVAFDTAPRLVQAATSDRAALRDAVMNLRPAGGTSLFDGVAFALQQFEGLSGKRALVVITDGKDVRSSTSMNACVRLAQQMGVPIYALSMMTSVFGNPLVGLATDTGGMFIPAPRAADMAAVFERVRDEVRGQYLITFVSPKRPVPGEWHELRVKVKDGRVKTVAGYRVP